MTHDELMALPDVTPRLGTESRVIDGRKVFVPVLQGYSGALFQGVADGTFVDLRGIYWTVGRSDGRRVRVRTL